MTLPDGTLVHRLAASVQVARTALRTGATGQPAIVRRHDGQPAVAFLAALTGTGDCDLVVPLRAGRNVVCRSGTRADHDWSPHREHLIEGGQWALRCHEDHTADVADAWSTNGGVVLTATAIARLAAVPHLLELDDTVGARLIHPAYHADTLAYHPIVEGELLIGIYRGFVFGWV